MIQQHAIPIVHFNIQALSSAKKLKWPPLQGGKHYRNEICYVTNTASWNRHNKPICLLEEVADDISDLKHVISDFLVKILKENGQEYPSYSL